MRTTGWWQAAEWAVCCSSSGFPCERASSGSALPAADFAPAARGSAEHPPAGEKKKRMNVLVKPRGLKKKLNMVKSTILIVNK